SSSTKARPTALAVATATAAAAAAAAAATAAVVTVCDEDRLERWNDRWATGRVAWHREKPNEILVKNYDAFMRPTDGQKPGAAARVLVPLCGKTVDMPYLAQKGHEVVGVDGVEAAVWQLQRDSWLKFETFQAEPSAESSGRRPGFIPAPTFEKRRSGYVFKTDTLGTGYYLDKKAVKWFRDTRKRISVVVSDFLFLAPGDIGMFDRVWDRGALVALRPEDREEYVSTCDSVLEPGGKILLATLVYDQNAKKGPPYSIPLAEVQRLYGGKLGYAIETLSSVDAREEYQTKRFKNLAQLTQKTKNEKRGINQHSEEGC
ncbi:unnamed protein product, partial [Ectocarpus sp. 6 AP-2014]